MQVDLDKPGGSDLEAYLVNHAPVDVALLAHSSPTLWMND
jgi:hypothetical protein